jgi:hypothetical protein
LSIKDFADKYCGTMVDFGVLVGGFALAGKPVERQHKILPKSKFARIAFIHL